MKEERSRNNPRLPRMNPPGTGVTIGRITMRRLIDGRLWVEHACGDAGTFDDRKLARNLESWFWRNF